MKRAHVGRGLRVTLPLLAVVLLASAFSPIGGASAHTAVTSHSAKACAKVGGPTRVGHFSGIIGAVPVGASCVKTSDAANGLPPLLWHGGPVMGTTSTGPSVVVTPIFWHPAGHPMDSSYRSIITQYLGDVAAESGTHTNVFSTLPEYNGSNGSINYDVQLGTPIDDTHALPASGCILMRKDRTGIYADGSGYNACLDDAQVTAETSRVVSANSLPIDLAHMYVLFLPKAVETCFFGGSTASGHTNACTINHEKSAAYCAYHNMASNSMVYANLSYPIYDSPVGFTCGSDARFPAIESPNGNPDADTEISPTSHEIMEAITDPDTVTGWYDTTGFENGDECAYVFGATQGSAGQLYNQVINGHNYLTQEEFSNNDFFATGAGCLQSE